MNGNEWKISSVLPTLLLAFLLAVSMACAGSSSAPIPLGTRLPAGAASLAGSSSPAEAQVIDRGASAAAVEAVERSLPALRGIPPDEQLRTLRWMLAIGDDQRLASLFQDLGGDRPEALERQGAEARQRLEELATDLERAGHQAPEPEAEVARVDPNAPPPNYFPPSMIQDLEKRQNDPEAARALEEARRTTPRGTRPPDR